MPRRTSGKTEEAILEGRRPAGPPALTLLVLLGLVFHASGKPVTTMAHGPKGTVEFQTLTLSARDVWNGVKTGQPVTISGELMLPTGDGRVPAIVLSHGGGAVTGTEDAWAREVRSLGVAVFMLDSFTGRGIKRCCFRVAERAKLLRHLVKTWP